MTRASVASTESAATTPARNRLILLLHHDEASLHALVARAAEEVAMKVEPSRLVGSEADDVLRPGLHVTPNLEVRNREAVLAVERDDLDHHRLSLLHSDLARAVLELLRGQVNHLCSRRRIRTGAHGEDQRAHCRRGE